MHCDNMELRVAGAKQSKVSNSQFRIERRFAEPRFKVESRSCGTTLIHLYRIEFDTSNVYKVECRRGFSLLVCCSQVLDVVVNRLKPVKAVRRQSRTCSF